MWHSRFHSLFVSLSKAIIVFQEKDFRVGYLRDLPCLPGFLSCQQDSGTQEKAVKNAALCFLVLKEVHN